MSELAPVPPRERLVSLDILRGLALWGVLVGNLTLYTGAWAAPWDPDRPEPPAIDQIAGWFQQIFISSKAQTLLCLLFGFGFAAQLLRAERRGEPVMGMYLRRIAALFVFGALHIALLWWGDVTWTYAVAAFGLLPFVRASNRTRLIAAVVVTFVPMFAYAIPEVWTATLNVFMTVSELRANTQQMYAALVGDSYAGLAWQHVTFAATWMAHIYGWYFAWVLGRFLVGFVAGSKRWFDDDGAAHLPVFRRFVIGGGLAGAVSTAISVLAVQGWIDFRAAGLPGGFARVVNQEVGLFAMVALGVGIVMLLVQRPRWRRMLAVVAPAGRMPLTTYMMQSLVATFAFYGWGLGWGGFVDPAARLAFALVVFPIQVALAHLWLRRFRYGPLEWLWRAAVYWRRP